MDEQHHTQGGGRISTPEYSSTLLPGYPTAPRRKRICKPKCSRSQVATIDGALSHRVLREGLIWTFISQIVENDDSTDDRLIEAVSTRNRRLCRYIRRCQAEIPSCAPRYRVTRSLRNARDKFTHLSMIMAVAIPTRSFHKS